MVKHYIGEQEEQDMPAEVKPLVIKEKANRKWLLIGWLNYEKGLFNPIPEHSKIGLSPAKTDVASAQFRRSDWLAAT